MKILITGGAGYIGSHTALALIEAGHEVVIYDSLIRSEINIISNLKKISKTKIFFVEGDILDTNLLKRTISSSNIEAVIHFAGLKSVSESTENPILYYKNNVAGSISLLESMKDCKVNKLVFSSSATVYGNPEFLPYKESHSKIPINTYGKTKKIFEDILFDLVETDVLFDWSIAILRYFNPIGAHDSFLIGENSSGISDNLMPYIIQTASKERDFLNIYGNDYNTKDGSGERDYIHIMDLADGHFMSLDYINNTKGVIELNLGSGRPTSVFELIEIFKKTNSVDVPIKICKRRNGDLASYYADISKAYNLLKWAPKRSVEEMCLSAWQAYKNKSFGANSP